MLEFYYCPRACSMASHVALEEAGATFEAREIDIFAGAHRTPAFLAVNPRGTVPALRFEDGRVLVETTAILAWVGAAYPEAALLGGDLPDRARTVAICAWLSGSVHPVFKQFVHPERFSAVTGTHAPLRAHAKEAFWTCLREIDAMLADGPWMMGERFTVADPYALVFYPWGRELGLPIKELTHLTAMKDRLIERPAARRALDREKSVLLSI